MRTDAAAEQTGEELRALGAEPVLIRGNVTSERVVDGGRGARAARRPRPQRRDRRDQAGARDGGQALGLDAERERPGAAGAGPRGDAVDAGGLVDRRDLEPGLDAGTRELCARRHLEGGPRVARAVSRGRARARGIRVNAVSGGVVETGALEHFPNREEMLAAGARNAAGRIVAPEDIAAAVVVPLLARCRDGQGADADRRRRLLAHRLSCSTGTASFGPPRGRRWPSQPSPASRGLSCSRRSEYSYHRWPYGT